MIYRKFAVAAAAIAVLAALPGLGAAPALSAEAMLRAANCFPKGNFLSRPFEAFIKEVNAKGRGVVKITYVGGAPAVGSPFEVVRKGSRGLYDIVYCTGSFYQNVLPEAAALKLIQRTNEELRANGGFDYVNKLHQEKNLFYLARIYGYTPFQLYLSRKIDKPDLSGLNLRVAPIYTPFFRALGATTQRSSIAQVYTLMDNGTVQGFGWSITGTLPDWHKVIKYRVEPGFYDADLQVLVNLETWKKMSQAQRDLLQQVGFKYERKIKVTAAADNAKAKKIQAAAGIRTIEFKGADREKWLSTAYKVGWDKIIERSPEHGPKLRKFFEKK